MDRPELVKQAIVEAWEGYVKAMREILPEQIIGNNPIPSEGGLSIISPIAAQIYRQLSSVTYIKIPPHYSIEDKEWLAGILEQADLRFIIMPNDIETIPTEEEEANDEDSKKD